MRRPRLTEDGFVQIVVLAGLMGLSALVTALLLQQQVSGRVTGALEDQVDGRWRAGSAIRSILKGQTLSTSLADLSVPIAVPVGDVVVTVSFEAEGGKINPVQEDATLIDEYLRNAGLDKVARDYLVQDLRTLTDPSQMEQLLLAALLPVLPEATIRQDLSTLGLPVGVNPLYATERVLQALPDLSDMEVDQVLRLRGSTPEMITGFSEYFATGGPFYTAVATMTFSHGGTYTLRVPFELTVDGAARPLRSY